MKKFLFVFIFLLFILQINAQQMITGKVTDDKNIPLPGVSVQVKNTTRGAFSDLNGGYNISDAQ